MKFNFSKVLVGMMSIILAACNNAPRQETYAVNPSLLLLNRNVLERVKHDIVRQSPDVIPAFEVLKQEADSLLGIEPVVDWKAMESMSDAVTRLALAYYFTDNETYAAKAATHLRTWFVSPGTSISPELDSAQGIDIVDTRCLAKMLDYVILLQSSDSWSETDDKSFRQWINDYLIWLQKSGKGKNESSLQDHRGAWHDFQVAVSSLYIGDSSSAANQIKKVTIPRLDKQLTALDLEPLVNLAIIGERVGLNLWQHVAPDGTSLLNAVESSSPGREDLNVLIMCSRKSAACRQQLKNLPCPALLQLTMPLIEGPVLSDADFYEALDLTLPGLKDVRKAVKRKDYVQARHAFASYLRSRTNVKWYFDPAEKAIDPDFDTTEADKVASHYLYTCGTAHQFGDIIDWSLNPTPIQYAEWTWQLGRHRHWQSLVEAYRATGNEKYANAWIDELRSWIDQSPLADCKATSDFSHWRTIEAGIRTLYAWPDAFFAFLHSEAFDEESMLWMAKSLYEHAFHIMQFSSHNNWLTMEMNGLFHISMMMPEFKDAGKWADFASRKMYDEQLTQFYPDGAQMELTPHYHGVSVTNYFEIASIAQLNGYKLPKDFLQRLESSIAYYMNIYMPDGCMPSVNDSGWGDTRLTNKDNFARSSEIYYAHDSGNDDIRTYLGNGYKILPDRTDFQYVATLGKEGTAPEFTSIWMPWAGWYVMRSGWDEKALYAFYEVGPYSASHSHEDKLSFLLHAYGSRLLTEGGVYSYDTSKWRIHTLSTPAHNASRVDGKDQHRQARPDTRISEKPLDNRWKTTDEFDFAEGFYNEGFGEDNDTTVTQYRALVFVKDKYWLLFDIFNPEDKEEHEYTTWFHFNQKEYKELPAFRAVGTSNVDKPNLYIYQLRSDAASLQVNTGKDEPDMMGWVTRGHRPVATPTFTRKQKGVCVEPYLLLPLDSGKSQPVSGIQTIDNTITVAYDNGTSDIISYEQEKGILSKLIIKTDGKELVVLP